MTDDQISDLLFVRGRAIPATVSSRHSLCLLPNYGRLHTGRPARPRKSVAREVLRRVGATHGFW